MFFPRPVFRIINKQVHLALLSIALIGLPGTIMAQNTKAVHRPALSAKVSSFIRDSIKLKGDTTHLHRLRAEGSGLLKRKSSIQNTDLDFYMSFLKENCDDNLCQSITYRTVTMEDTLGQAAKEFTGFRDFLETAYPLVHKHLTREVVGGYSLLYRWAGTRKNLKPILIVGHMDVVPIEPGTEQNWNHPAFAGNMADGYIWGRGSIDDKVCVVGALEAVETLLAGGYQPDRDIYFAFGHDEELNGDGAAAMAQLLEKRGISFECVLDEGGGIAEGLVPDIDEPLAFIGIAEKGYLTVELSVEDEGGHSSFPKQETVLGILSGAVHSLETNQFPERLTTPVRQMLNELGGKIGGIEGFAAKHSMLFSSLLKHKLNDIPYTNSLIQTTTAVTVLEGGVRENVMPTHAHAVVNFRILPGETVKSVLARVKKVVDDKRVKITPYPYACDPPKVSSIHSGSYKALKRTVQSIYGDSLTVVPALSISSSDSRHYDKIADNIYRFSPLWAKPGDIERLHGTNERISVDDYNRAITFYCQFMLNCGKKDAFNILTRKQ